MGKGMKVLKSHRDSYFDQWNMEDWVDGQGVSTHTRFDYVSVDKMQRGDATTQATKWVTEDERQNARLLNLLRESIPKDGMFSPLILIVTNHKHWKPHLHHFWLNIPFVIQTGNNRYQVAKENGYTHISSIVLGINVNYDVWNYLEDELKKPLKEKIRVDKGYLRNVRGLKL